MPHSDLVAAVRREKRLGRKTVSFRRSRFEQLEDRHLLSIGWTAIYSEDFSTDPGWITNNAARYYWSPSSQSYSVTQTNIPDGGEYAYRDTDFSGGSFCMEWDIRMLSNAYASDVRVGLFDSTMDTQSDGSYASVFFTRADGGYFPVLHTSRGTTYSTNGQFSFDTWYHVQMQYEQDVQTLSATITARDTGQPLVSYLLTGVQPFATLIDRVGTSNVRSGGFQVPDAQSSAEIDNVKLSADVTIDEGDTFSRTGSFTDPGADTWTATVDYGDGSGVQSLPLTDKTFTLSHTYADNGVYQVTVTVRDDDAGSGSDTLQVTVNNVAPVVIAGADATINEGDTFSGIGAFTDPGADTWTATVDYGDGSGVQDLQLNPDKTFLLNHTYVDNGVYQVTVTVTDDDAGNGSDTLQVTVNNIAPVVDAGGDATINEGDTFSRIGSFTDPGADTWTATVDYGDGSGVQSLPLTDKTFTLSHTYADNGIYQVTVTITDDDAGKGTAAVKVRMRDLVDFSGRVFDDRNNNGLFEPAEGDTGIAGVTIELWDETVGCRIGWGVTAVDGTYLLDSNLNAGRYRIVEIPPLGWLDGRETAGTIGGFVRELEESDQITAIQVGEPGMTVDGTGYNFAELRPALLQGLAWDDFTGDGLVDLGEKAIVGVSVTLTGTDDRGPIAPQIQTTNAQGIFEFASLRPGTYSVTESHPAGFIDGVEVLGEVVEAPPAVVLGDDGVVAATGDAFDAIRLVAGSSAINYNFAERLDGGGLSTGQTATIGFWQNKNGQALIRSLNGDGSTLLGSWLSNAFSQMYGGGILDANQDGRIVNDEVAETYRLLFKRNAKTSPGGPPKLDAQVLAVALAAFVTKADLGGLIYDPSDNTDVDFLFYDANADQRFVLADGDGASVDGARIAAIERYGFDVTDSGVGGTTYNVGSRGAAFGVANDTDVRIIDLLLATDSMSWHGLLYDTNGSGHIGDSTDQDELLLRVLANDVYSAINEHGSL